MTAYDVRAKASAGRALAPIARGGKGQAITLTTPFVGVFDPATDTTTTGEPTVQTTSGLVVEYTTFIRSGLRNEPGSLILAGDKELLLSPFRADGMPLSPEPAVGDLIALANGGVFTLTSIAPLSPAEVRIYFDCNIRGST